LVNKVLVLIVVGIMFAFGVAAAAEGAVHGDGQSDVLISSGDRVVFLGDSITEQMIYNRYVINYFTLRYPGMKLSFRNAGWGGDTAVGGLSRLKRDVLSLKPTVVTICYGMNDGGYKKLSEGAMKNYQTGMSGLVSELKKAGVKVVLLTPGCVDPDRNPDLKGYNDTLEALGKYVQDLARTENVPFFDLHSLMMDVQNRAKKADPSFTMIPDGVHPSQPGHAIMAYALLKALGCRGRISSLVIDAAAGKSSSEGCVVSKLEISDDRITFIRRDDTLPAYFDPEAQGIFSFVPITDELNRYMLRVTGLRHGQWKLDVDGIEVGNFSSDDLARGVNLALMQGPWRRLGEEVNRMSAEQAGLYFNRWRNIGLMNLPKEAEPERKALLAKLDKALDDMDAERVGAVSKRDWVWTLAVIK